MTHLWGREYPAETICGLDISADTEYDVDGVILATPDQLECDECRRGIPVDYNGTDDARYGMVLVTQHDPQE